MTTMSYAGTKSDRVLIAPLMLAALTWQALVVVLTPSIAAVGRDFGVSVSVVGQARTISAAVALATALILIVFVSTLGVRRIAEGGAIAAVIGSLAVATAPGLVPYLAAHVVMGLAQAALLTAAFTGLACFTGRARTWGAGWVTAAAGTAWVIGNPIVGTLTEHVSWRVAQAFPAVLALGVLALSRHYVGRVTAVHGGAFASLLKRPGARRWVLAETLANVAWGSVLTYVGGLFVVGLGTGEGMTGWLLAIGATCFVIASVHGGRIAADLELRAMVTVLDGLLAVAVLLLFGTVLLDDPGRWGTVAGTAGFAVTGILAGLRIPATAVLGMAQHPKRTDVMMAARTAVLQMGYLIGAALSGGVIALVGWAALGPVLAVILVAAAVGHRRLAPTEPPTPASRTGERAAGAP